MRLWEPVRRLQQIRGHRVTDITVEGLEHVSDSIAAGHGVLITPNHAGHADCYLLLDALLKLKTDSYFMTAWQVFALANPIIQQAYRQHGCFSIDRERSDLAAYREAVRVLSKTSCPLVVFPEGDVYHLAEKVLPPRDGTFTIAMNAVRKSGRPVACTPCALKYTYIEDPTAELLTVMADIERKLEIGNGDSLSLADRAERLIESTICWRESQYLERPGRGSLEQRLERLQNAVLARGEHLLDLDRDRRSLPERVKLLRQTVIGQTKEDSAKNQGLNSAELLEDAFIAIQLYSYVPGYVAERPTIERIAETVDKLEEDVLGLPTANIRGKRHGTIRFAPPTVVETAGNRAEAQQLGKQLRDRMQELVYSQPTSKTIEPCGAGEYA